MDEGNNVAAIVIDNGSGKIEKFQFHYLDKSVFDFLTDTIKAGLAGDHTPQAIFPTIVGRPARQDGKHKLYCKDNLIGNGAQSKRGNSNYHPKLLFSLFL